MRAWASRSVRRLRTQGTWVARRPAPQKPGIPPTTCTPNDEVMIATLHIEHEITDYPTWKAAFDRFADARRRGGVIAHRVRLLEDDDHQIVIDLDFSSAQTAHAFSTFLHDTVWGTSNAPALVDTPTTRILVEAAD